MKLCINGWAQHGKDTVGDMFALLGLGKFPISLAIAEDIMNETNLGPYESVQECYENRVHNRAFWYNFIRNKCADDPAHYVKIALEKGDIFCGHRNTREFEASKHLFDATIWVDASIRGKEREGIESCDLTPAGHDYIIQNDRLPDTMRLVATIYEIIDKKKKRK